MRAEDVGQDLRAASDLPSYELDAAVDEYCHAAGIDPEAEWVEARRQDAGLRREVCRYAVLRDQKRDITYESLLHTFEWLEKRDDILKRDGHRCAACRSSRGDAGDSGILQVHHRYYVLGWLPWDYPDEALVTLCMSCHWHLHETRQVPVYEPFGGDLVPSDLMPCRRCYGAGFFPQYMHVEEGICFRCRGACFEAASTRSD
jgi:5-methylcytosine-specific restriction endonuclease McrA